VTRLEQELTATRGELQTTVEELKSSNEELTSMNEELQSSNEELETSREELHSINEELTTVNVEMQHKVEDLSNANNDLQNFINSSRIATLFLDKNLMIRRFTPQISEYFNILEVDIDRPFGHLRPKIDYESILDDIGQVLDSLTPLERQLPNRDGRWIMARIMPYRSVNDRIDGVVLTFVDVTPIRTAEQRLSEQTAELESLYQATPDIYFRVGLDNRILNCRSSDEPEIIPDATATTGKHFSDIFPGETAQVIENVVREARDADVHRSTALYLGVGDKARHLEVRVIPASDETFVIMRDITELRIAEERIQFQANALSQVSDAIIAVDDKDSILLWNAGAERILGKPAERALNQDSKAIFGAGLIAQGSVMVANGASEDTRPMLKEIEYARADGGKIIMESSVSDLRNKQGERVGLLAILRDITERKRIERELQEAKEKTETASQAKSEFLANMSHEIRTPLNGIMGMTELLLKTELAETQRSYLAGIKDSIVSLRTIISDILDLSKIEARKLDLANEPFDLGETLEAALAPLKMIAVEKGLRINFLINPGIPMKLKGDPLRLRQILNNLVGNAIKFTVKGSIDIQVGTLDLLTTMTASLSSQAQSELSMPAPVRLLVSVRDTGVGIPLEDQKSIFDMFVQGDISSKKKHMGSGLGLTIVRNLVELMHGNIWVVSKVGQGSTFYFNVLLQQQSLLEAQPDSQEDLSVTLPPLKILVVEDNALNRLYAKEILRQEGHTVMAVESGLAGLAALEKESFDVVLLDISMPDMDGIEVIKRIRGASGGGIDPNTVVIALTAYAFEEDKERILRAGMNGYIAKPVEPEALMKALKLIAKKRG
jgi:two-component system, chemotaxis family, CheB/CheR fusion protein